MLIGEFKEGDFVTRTGKNKNGDCSYIGDKLIFLGLSPGSIWYINSDYVLDAKNIRSVPLERWDDNNWGYYPEKKIKEWTKKYCK